MKWIAPLFIILILACGEAKPKKELPKEGYLERSADSTAWEKQRQLILDKEIRYARMYELNEAGDSLLVAHAEYWVDSGDTNYYYEYDSTGNPSLIEKKLWDIFGRRVQWRRGFEKKDLKLASTVMYHDKSRTAREWVHDSIRDFDDEYVMHYDHQRRILRRMEVIGNAVLNTRSYTYDENDLLSLSQTTDQEGNLLDSWYYKHQDGLMVYKEHTRDNQLIEKEEWSYYPNGYVKTYLNKKGDQEVYKEMEYEDGLIKRITETTNGVKKNYLIQYIKWV